MPLDEYIKKNIYFLNMFELATISNHYSLPIYIYVETKNNGLRKTNNKDVKMKLIERILYYLKTKKRLSPTIYLKNVVKYMSANNITENSIVYYGQYKNGNNHILKIMDTLTNKKYFEGAVSTNLLRLIWSEGKAITYKSFAKLWLKEINKETLHPEWRYINFLKENDKSKWKKTRTEIAKTIFKKLNISFPEN